MKLKTGIVLILQCFAFLANAQSGSNGKSFSHADSLRGSITAERSWWNLLHYDLHVTPDLTNKTITGKVDMFFQVLQDGSLMQIDLQEPLILDSVLFNQESLSFKRDGNAFFISFKKR